MVNAKKHYTWQFSKSELIKRKEINKKDLIKLIAGSPFENAGEVSIRKKVDNWQNNLNRIDRNSAFQLCVLQRYNL